MYFQCTRWFLRWNFSIFGCSVNSDTLQQYETHSFDSVRYFVCPLRIVSWRRINLGLGFETVQCPMAGTPDCSRMLDPDTPFCLAHFLVQRCYFVLGSLSDRLSCPERWCVAIKIVILPKIRLDQHNWRLAQEREQIFATNYYLVNSRWVWFVQENSPYLLLLVGYYLGPC